jgi:hypothetical protein
MLFLLGITISACDTQHPPPPQFRDQGAALDSILQSYQADSVEFENMREADLTDSALTVALVNCKRLPSADPDSSARALTGIASVIHRTVLDHSRYKSYYIVFVESYDDGVFKMPYRKVERVVRVDEIEN